MISDKQQFKEDSCGMQEKRIARIKTVLKFAFLLALCLMILAPWLAALLNQLKG